MGLYLSVTSRSSIETTKRIDIVFGIDAFFLLLLRSAVSAKVTILPFRTASQTLDLENFATARRSCLVNKTRRRSSLLTTLAAVDAS